MAGSGNRLFDRGSSFLECGSSHLPGRGLPHVGWACLLVSILCVPTFRGMIAQDVGRNMFETRLGYLGASVFS
jgi:hypothetical protein